MIWLTALQTPPAHCTPQQWEWLVSADSLTARLKKISGHQARLEVLNTDWMTAGADEQELLNIDNQRTWIREIVHCFQHQTWVWARVVLPEKTLQKTGLNCQTLDSLGNILFQDPQLKRTNLAVTLLAHHQPYTNQPAWARQSVLWYHQQPLLVKEVFLPAFFDYVQQQNPP